MSKIPKSKYSIIDCDLHDHDRAVCAFYVAHDVEQQQQKIVTALNSNDDMLREMESLAKALEDTGHEPPQSFYDAMNKARGV